LICRLTDFDFTKMFWRDMIQGSDFNPFRDFNLGVHERRAQFEYGGQTVMIRWMQCQHEGSSQRLAWDPRTAVFDNSAVDRLDTDEMANFRLPEINLGMLRIGCLEEWSSRELIEFMQGMNVWLIRGSQIDYCTSTLRIGTMSRGCLTTYMPVWDPGDFITCR
jgi:hypothetical protein